MGKTPGKWIKKLLLGKKSSKSNPSKGREVLKPSNKGEQLVSSMLSGPDVTSDAPIISPPIVGTVVTGNEISSDNGAASKLQSEEVVLSNVKEDGSTAQAVMSSMATEDPERIKLELAATKAQAAFRGYAARREFRTLKCIIMLQAHARGHLVRRQAVSTLCCVKEIVKFQAIVRARKDAKVSAAAKFRRLSKRTFVFKLRASMPTAIPLRLQYGSGEPNSASLWLERWTRSHFWVPISELKKNSDSKSRRSEQDKSKKSVRRISSANVENGPACSTLDSEKGKRNPKKVSSHSVNSAHERPPIEIEKVKRGSKKTTDPTKEVFDRLEVDNGKLKHKTRKPLDAAAPQGASDSAEKLKDVPTTSPKQSDLEKDVELPKGAAALQGASDSAEKLKDVPTTSPKQSDLEKDVELPNAENGKPKHKTRKPLGAAAPAISEQGASDSAEKSKDVPTTSPKQSDLEKDVELPNAENGKPKHKTRKPLSAAAPASSEQGASDSAEKSKDVPMTSPKQSDLEKDVDLPNAENSIDKLHCQSSLDLQPMDDIGKTQDIQELNRQLGSKDDSVLNDNPKTSQRRASLPAKFDPQENGSQNTPKLPSYMAPTESAKARLRGQGSPRFSRDTIEKNVLLRRHSLSSSTNSTPSSLSPRAHKLVQATGRGAFRGDRSLSSSRDGGDKLIQAEWRR